MRSVRIDGQPVDLDQFVPHLLDDRLIVSFPPLTGSADSFKQVEVDFDVPVLRFRYRVQWLGLQQHRSRPDPAAD